MKDKIGLFLGGILVKEYENSQYDEAIKDAEFAFEESGVLHEIKFY